MQSFYITISASQHWDKLSVQGAICRLQQPAAGGLGKASLWAEGGTGVWARSPRAVLYHAQDEDIASPVGVLYGPRSLLQVSQLLWFILAHMPFKSFFKISPEQSSNSPTMSCFVLVFFCCNKCPFAKNCVTLNMHIPYILSLYATWEQFTYAYSNDIQCTSVWSPLYL